MAMLAMTAMPVTTQVLAQLQAKTAKAPAPASPDTYTPSSGTSGIVSRKDMLALMSNETVAISGSTTSRELPVQSVVMRGALSRKDYDGVEKAMGEMNKVDRLRTLEELRGTQPKTYETLMAAIRAGKIDAPEVTIPAGIDRLKGTKFAQSGAGLDTALHVERQYVEGRLKLGAVQNGATAFTSPDINEKGIGQNGRESKATITVASQMGRSPEGMAALLAHEGQHSFRYNNGTLKSNLYEETDAHMAQSAVWNEFGDTKMDAKLPALKGLNNDADYYDSKSDSKMMGHVANEYAEGYLKFGTKADLDEAKAILWDFSKENKARKNGLVEGGVTDDLMGILGHMAFFEKRQTEDSSVKWWQDRELPVALELRERGEL